MNEHYKKYHTISLKLDTFEFKSIDDFNNWKCEIQLSTQILYVKNYGSSERWNQMYSYNKCHISDYYNSISTGQKPWI